MGEPVSRLSLAMRRAMTSPPRHLSIYQGLSCLTTSLKSSPRMSTLITGFALRADFFDLLSIVPTKTSEEAIE